MRTYSISRKTKETDISITLNLDGTGQVECNSGNGFFDHMIDAFGHHGQFDLNIQCKGDTWVDFHHSAEDIGIVMGEAFAECTREKTGLKRFGSAYTPLDESLARAVSDLSGRPFLVFQASFPTERTGDYENELTEEFFRAFAMHAKITLHISLMYGNNSHHINEAIFKSVGRSLAESVRQTGGGLLSTKGVI